ncbi:MAG TPA: ParB/RepB/Spo0J family partition protein [Candidatus Saccharimonadales bacterium]
MAAKKGLGRGFESLIPTDLLDESFDPTAADDKTVSELRHVKLTEIDGDKEQPRKHFDEVALAELRESIMQHGVLQPIVVTPKHGRYIIVAGERRFRASQSAGLKTIPALVRTLSDQHKLELALIENIQRRDLNALETATAYAKLRDQFNMTLDQIGKSVGGKSVSAVSNTLRLLRLPKLVQKAVVEGDITEGQARPLVDMDEKLALELLPQIIQEGMSARKIELLARGAKAKKAPALKKSDEPFGRERKELEDYLKTNVRVTTTNRGAGQIVIRFKDAEEFERIRKTLL